MRLSESLDNGARGGFPGMMRATVQRSRSTVRAPEATGEAPGDIADLSALVSQAEPPSPRALLEEVRSPGVARAEVDALLSGLERPLGPGETARERADLLHELLEDEQVREYTGSGGRKVAHVAVLRLGELGFPYALEVPPELYAQARAAAGHGEHSSMEPGARHRLGVALASIAGGLEVLPALFVALDGNSGDMEMALGWVLGVSLTSWVPALLADAEPVSSRRWLLTLMRLVVALPGLLWLAAAIFVLLVALSSGAFAAGLFFLVPLGMAVLRLGGASLLSSKPPGAEQPEIPSES